MPTTKSLSNERRLLWSYNCALRWWWLWVVGLWAWFWVGSEDNYAGAGSLAQNYVQIFRNNLCPPLSPQAHWLC